MSFFDDDDFYSSDPAERDMYSKIRTEERIKRKIQKQKAIKKRNKTYLKGRRGVRLYYDITKRDVPKDANAPDYGMIYDESIGRYRYTDYDIEDEDEDDDFYENLGKSKPMEKVLCKTPPLEDYEEWTDDDEEDEYEGFDEDYAQDIDDFKNPERQIKCVFKQKLRRDKLFGYLKYLKGRKVLNRDLAWKFAVTKRTIQSDLRWLENNGFIVTQKNKTYKGKQTKNSYIVNLEKRKGLPCEDTRLGIVIIAKQDNEYYVLAKTNYKSKDENPKRFIPIKECYFKLPQTQLKVESRIEHKSNLLVSKLFETNIEDKFQGHVYTTRFIKIKKYRDDMYKWIVEKSSVKILYSMYVVDNLNQIPVGYKWIKLKTANRYFTQTIDNKCLNKVKLCWGEIK